MNNKNRYENRRGAALLLLGALLIIAVIIFLKTQTPQAQPSPQMPADSTTSKPSIAVPDTTLSPDVQEDTHDNVAPAAPDSIGADPRSPDEAGAEDGYWNGLYDGIAGQEQAGQDVTSNFPTEEERRIYAENYRESYIQGFREGSKQKANP